MQRGMSSPQDAGRQKGAGREEAIVSNGKIDDAEIDALLTGDQRAVDRFLVTGIRELKRGQAETKAEVGAMRRVCEQRGRMCPGMHAHIADPVEPIPAAGPPTDDRRTWAMWGVGTTLLREIALPVLVVIATLVFTGKL
jgi:hypothetical protein